MTLKLTILKSLLQMQTLYDGNLCGEVKGEYIYNDNNIQVVFQTLKHEFVDYIVSEVIEPYMEVTNKLIALLNERAYQHKEKLVEKLASLI